MRKKNKTKYQRESLSPEIKRGIAVVVLVAFAILSLLSFFHLTGRAGVYIVKLLKILFGGGFVLFPFILIFISYIMISPRRENIRKLHYASFAIFILSFYALLHLRFRPEESFQSAKEGLGGGFLGFVLSFPLEYFFSFWGSLIALVAFFLIALLIMLNISLNTLFGGLEIFKIAARKGMKAGRNIREKAQNLRKKEDESVEEYEDHEISLPKEDLIEEIKEQEQDYHQEEKISAHPKSILTVRNIDIPLVLLDGKTEKPKGKDIKNTMDIIQKTLANFGISVEMGDVSVGPTVTQYTFRPSEGIKLSRVITLHNDLALALAAHPIRIEAPIPGKSLVGIEIPNQRIATVRLRELLEAQIFKKRSSNLMLPLGKNVAGELKMFDLTRMPHLLIAGSTGSGKTICINSLILSLLFQNSPDLLKLVLIDPKRVELPVYNNIPHLIAPVITDVKKTVKVLKWAISEMDRRFEVLAEAKRRDIESYNSSEAEKLPYIIIIIDELADLMASSGAEIEAAIIRLAQMSRAVGIHLILATQRPSVNVITGLIKANINARIAFSVASAIDSRTILDTSGAEKLLGRGDMLFVNAELGKPIRLQGAYVSEEETKKIASFLKSQAEADYDESLQEKLEAKGGPDEFFSGADDGNDELFYEAKDIILKAKKASASLLQRRLRIGYARAARLLDILEEQGIIGPADGAKPREILISAVPAREEEEKDHGETMFK